MEIASSGASALIQQQAMQYNEADRQQSQSVSQTQPSTPQASLDASAPSTATAAPTATRVGGSIDTYA